MGYFFGNLDVYVNIVGGLKIYEPAADLPVALALYSSLKDKPVDEKIIAIGEVGLGGEIRSVTHLGQRIQEAKRLGFEKCIVPKHSLGGIKPPEGIEVIGVSSLKQAFGLIT